MYDVIIIGAGVVGSAAAFYLSQYEMKVALLDAENDVSNGTSKANSAIIHGGYDPEEGSLMAKYNVEGSILTKELAEKLDVPYINNGALVLAFRDEDLETIEMLYQRGLANGVKDLEIINRDEVKKLEPNVSDEVKGALYCHSSAIISPWEFTLALAETAVKNGVDIKLSNKVTAIEKTAEGFKVTTTKDAYQSKYIINAAGVNADEVFELVGEKEFTIYPNRGQYYLLDKSQGKRVTRTIFQCPNKDGKGVLVSPTVHGNMIVGPDSQPLSENDVSTTAEGLAFVKEKATLTIKDIDYRENIRNFAGVRARSDRGDFIVEESKSVKNFFNLAGMASPGLSSAAAIGVAVKDMILEKEAFPKKEHYIETRKRIRFKDLNNEERNELIKNDPRYGKIICRCESISEGEIMACFNTPIPPVSIDGVKRRVNAGLGRCQGGFCSEKVAMILKKELNVDFKDILLDKEGSNILLDEAKGGLN